MEQSLAETILWCTSQPWTPACVESAEIIRRRGLVEEAHRLFEEARRRGQRKWFRRNAYKSPEWQRAREMLKEASPDSIAPLRDQLRSPALKPENAIDEYISEAERETLVAGLLRKRSSLLAAHGRVNQELSLLKNAGKVLLYFPAENVADGASSYSSRGFFDLDDAPPWDTWVDYSDRTLTCWVPEAFVSVAQNGIDANPVECIRWAD
jgi:hypothetical protein